MDDISAKISEVLSDPENMQMIKGLLASLGSESAEQASRGGGAPKEETGAPESAAFDAETLLKVKKALSLIRQDDPRVKMLMALRPNLSEPRQKRVDEAIQLMRLVNLIPLLEDGIFKWPGGDGK
jgi:hypothetical protein